MSGALLGILAFLLVAGTMALWTRRIRNVAIPKDRRAYVACWAGGAVLGIIALVQGAGWIGGSLAGVAALAGTFFSALVLASPQKASDDAIQVGEPLRQFSAIDEKGEEFSLAGLADKPVLLKFFRGHW